MEKNYYRLMLGAGSTHAPECFAGNFIGVDFGIQEDLSHKLPENSSEFNTQFIPIFLSKHPDRTKIGAGLACGALWTVTKGIQKGDVVLCPDGSGNYRFGEVQENYYYATDQILPHRRKVAWVDITIAKSDMSEALKNSCGSIGTLSNITRHQAEIEALLGATPAASVTAVDPDIENPVAFALEAHLEAFLVDNWDQTLLSEDFSIYEEAGEPLGQQYTTDAGRIDVLAISKDKKRLLVVELKRGRATDTVVGQVLRYMGFIKEQIAESDQLVEGAIISLEDDQKMRWALLAVPNVSFYRYQISFKLVKD